MTPFNCKKTVRETLLRNIENALPKIEKFDETPPLKRNGFNLAKPVIIGLASAAAIIIAVPIALLVSRNPGRPQTETPYILKHYASFSDMEKAFDKFSSELQNLKENEPRIDFFRINCDEISNFEVIRRDYYIAGPDVCRSFNVECEYDDSSFPHIIAPWEIAYSAAFDFVVEGREGEVVKREFPLTVHYFQKLYDAETSDFRWMDSLNEGQDGSYANLPPNNNCKLGGSTQGVVYNKRHYLIEENTNQIILEFEFESLKEEYPYAQIPEDTIANYEAKLEHYKTSITELLAVR